MCYGVCSKCKQQKHLTKHHIRPRRIVRPRPNQDGQVILLCEDYHKAIEVRLHRRETEVIRQERFRYNPHIVALLRDKLEIYEDELRRFLA